ncbi:MAG TPA: hypothetical protein DCY40_08520 [Actinobacteria bacterium]|nr:hypothetical protein [Actinomycetota bacterium]
MRRVAAVLIAVLALVPACGDDDAPVSMDPADIDTCEGAADAMIAVLDDTLVIVDSMTPEELAALGSDALPPALVDVRTRGEALAERAEVIGCEDEQMAALLAARADELSSDTVFGQFLIESLRSGAGSVFLGE